MTPENAVQAYRRVTVVGISANPDRPSHWIAQYLKSHGFEVTGVNPGMPHVPGIEVVPSLADVEGPLEIVDVFRSPAQIPPLMEELILLQPKVVWLQPGAQNPEAEERGRSQGLEVISGPCIYQVHRHLGRS
ncbi:MAG TPA: CoA-binding protein [Bdellovibrionota bacterium]|jgi:predicted CoA-binding protein|nr:CoA-binding protein [Bdellovibrionota bacterium]